MLALSIAGEDTSSLDNDIYWRQWIDDSGRIDHILEVAYRDRIVLSGGTDAAPDSIYLNFRVHGTVSGDAYSDLETLGSLELDVFSGYDDFEPEGELFTNRIQGEDGGNFTNLDDFIPSETTVTNQHNAEDESFTISVDGIARFEVDLDHQATGVEYPFRAHLVGRVHTYHGIVEIDASNTAGLVSVTDSNGEPLEGWTPSLDSGMAIVPEPKSAPFIYAGIAFFAAWLGRSLKRRS